MIGKKQNKYEVKCIIRNKIKYYTLKKRLNFNPPYLVRQCYVCN
jgi:hypothetical protein